MTTLTPTFTGLHPLAPDTLSFASDVAVRAFVVERDHGNILVYNTEHAAEAVAGHDIGWHYLNHWHEAMWGLDDVAQAHGAPVLVHAADHAEALRTANDTTRLTTFDERHKLGEGFELIPIPGHTPGATAFLYEREGVRFLFTGDSLYLRHGEWVAAMLATSDRGAYLESLDVIRNLEFDVLVPWAAQADEPFYALTDDADRHARVTKIMDRLWKGQDR